LVAPGDPSKKVAGGPFAHDGGVRALRDQLVTLLRPASNNNSDSLAAFGITANKDGTLALDASRLSRQLAIDPAGLDKLIGSTAAGSPSGIAAGMDKLLKAWNNTTDGQIKKRQAEIDKSTTALTKRQDLLDQQFDAAYKRYLIQFTNLQSMQNKMNGTKDMFDALFGNNKST
jgi:flagellar hook-associated protein 2